MRKTALIVITAILVFGINSAAFAHITPTEKLKMGVHDLITAPFGVFTHMSERVSNSDDKLTSFVAALVEGGDTFIVKTFSGVVNIVTFPIPIGEKH